MPSIHASSSFETLKSAISTNDLKSAVISKNLAHKDTNGYMREELLVSTYSGLSVKKIQQVVDDFQIKTLRDLQTQLGEQEAYKDFYAELSSFFGSATAQGTLSHSASRMIDVMKSVGLSDNPFQKKAELIQHIEAHLQDIHAFSQLIQNLQSEVDEKITDAAQNINALLKDLQTIQSAIRSEDSLDLLNNRRDKMAQLSKYLPLHLSSEHNVDKFSIFGPQGLILLQHEEISHVEFADGEFKLNLLGNQSQVTKKLAEEESSGALKSLWHMRDKLLPTLSAQLGEYTKHLQFTFDELHNEGSCVNRPVLQSNGFLATGEKLSENTVFQGSGVLRVAQITSSGHLVNGQNYFDIQLTRNMTVKQFMTSFNQSSFARSRITEDGKLSLASQDASFGLALGNGSQKAEIFDEPHSINYGFSHFFGLNNFFSEKDEKLSLRKDIKDDLSKFSTGSLSHSSSLDLQTPVLGIRDFSILEKMTEAFQKKEQFFGANHYSPQIKTSLQNYTVVMMEGIKTQSQKHTLSLKQMENHYNAISAQTYEKSGVKERIEWQNAQHLFISQSILYNALSVLRKMQEGVLSV